MIVVIAGLPASGKSTLGKKLATRLNYLLIDDFDLMFRDGDFYSFENSLKLGNSYVITESLAVNESWRNEFISRFSKYVIKFIVFANEPERCIRNSELRENKPVKQYIKQLAKNYSAPDAAIIVPVFRQIDS